MHAVSKMSPVLSPMFSAGSDDNTTCRMCLVRFSYPSRLPLSLQCLHTYCSQCVFSWTCNKTKQKLSCPMCGKITKVDKGKKVQECLPINHAVLELSSIVQTSHEEYHNGYGGNQMSQDFHHANPHGPMFGPQTNLSHTGYNHHESTGLPQVDDIIQAAGGRGKIVDVKIVLTCEDQSSGNNRIYPDIPQPSASEVFNPYAAAQCKPNSTRADCGNFQNYNNAGLQQNGYGNGNAACQPSNGKPQPALSINIGSIRFQKPDGKEVIESESYERRNESPGRTTDRPGAVTELSVNSSPRQVKRLPNVPVTSCIAKISSDKCVKCNVNPAAVTMTNSQEKSVQRLCSDCYAAIKDKRGDDCKDEMDCKHKPRPVLNDLNNQARTVVKIQSKAPNGEVARSSPVWESRTKQSFVDPEKKIDTANKSSVLRLGDPIKSAISTTPHMTCSNQVGLICGPFKSEQSLKTGDNGENIGARVSCGKPDTSPRGNANDRDRVRNVTAEAARKATIDIGTLDQPARRAANRSPAAPTDTDTILVNTRPARPVSADNEAVTDNSGFRPREYVVGPMISASQNIPEVAIGRSNNAALTIRGVSRPDAFNPQYNESDFEAQSISDLGLPTVEPVNLLQRATTKQQEAASYANQSTNNAVMYPTLSAPPRYEEIMAESKLNGLPPGGGEYIPRFGKYGESSSQPGALRGPARVSVERDDRVVVVDTMNRTIQVFEGQTGECVSLIRNEAVTGCCLARDGSMVVATSKGVEVYKANGALNKKVDMGPVITVVAYRNGFVAAETQALVAFRELGRGTSKTLTEMRKASHSKSFRNIIDVAVNNLQDFLVLDSGAVYVLSDDGVVKRALKPHQQPCGPLTRPTSVGVDDSNNVFVSDAGRVLMFNASGQFLKDIFEPIARSGLLGGHSRIVPAALGVGRNGRVYIALRGDMRAEIIVVSYH